MNIKDTKLSGGCHVVILGAGASIASTIRDPEEHGLKLPSMNNLPDVVGLHGCLSHFPQELIQDNFEATYSNIAEHDPDNMAAGPASYGMTDTLGRMHSDAQFAGSSSVPAHVEMMGFLGIGNNPMVGCTVACAVQADLYLNKK